MSFKLMVDRVRELIRREGELSVPKLAYMLNISPSRAAYLLRAAAEIDENITYISGRATYFDGRRGGEKP